MSVVAVGFFDGVHLGHREILRCADVAITFRNHPLSVLAPGKAPRLIMNWTERERAILNLGVKQVEALDFTEEFASRSPEAFLGLMRELVNSERLTVRCGENWRFGKNGVGDADWLRSRGVEVAVVRYAQYDGEAVSSTRIRSALAAGELSAANAMLGSAYTLGGEIFPGKGEGTAIGFPTVNIRPGVVPLLPNGVYAVEVAGARGIANLGLAPTFGERAWNEPVLEVHFLGNVPTIDDSVRVEFRRFIRAERRFASVHELKDQISADIDSCR